jgi:hypothetical protein
MHGTHLHRVLQLWAVRHGADLVAQQPPQRAQQPPALASSSMHRLVQQPVRAKLCVAARQACSVQDGQLRLALIVLCVVAVLQRCTRVRLVHLMRRQQAARARPYTVATYDRVMLRAADDRPQYWADNKHTQALLSTMMV